jgi:hypothetical protein
MKIRYRPGERVRRGTYLNGKTWELVSVTRNGDPLPASKGVTYYRAPLPLVLLVGPFVGLAFVIFLPFAVPALLLQMAGRRLARAMSGRREAEARSRAGPPR